MKIVLRTDVAGVGKRGDVAEVADGYARNYLLPKGKALVATPGAEAQAEAMRRARIARAAESRSDAIMLADRLALKAVTIPVKAGKGGKLFGSVTTSDIVDAVKAQLGATLDKRHMSLPEPIKKLGSYTATAHLVAEVDATVSIEVIAQ